MTNEHAIKVIKDLKNYYNDKSEYNDGYIGFDKEDNEAIDLAIQVLESKQWIPKNATNGDMIISLYPNLKYYVNGDRVMTTIGVASSFDLDWWNAPYREEDAE